MSLDRNAGPAEFLGESDDDPLIPMVATQVIREFAAFLQDAEQTGHVDVHILIGFIIDAEVRAVLAEQHNVLLIDGLNDATADRMGDLLEDGRHLAEECGVSFDQLEAMKREHATRLEGEIRRRQGY